MNQILHCGIIIGFFLSESIQAEEVTTKSSNKANSNLRSIQSLNQEKVKIFKGKGKKASSSSASTKHSSTKGPKKSKKSKGSSSSSPKKSKGSHKKGGKKKKKIPKKCLIPNPLTEENYSNDECDTLLNTKECKYDGGDCKHFNKAYPDCNVDQPKFVGDEYCDGPLYNTTECGFDGGDCLINSGAKFGCSGAMNGFCENLFNIPECDYDGGDCDTFNELYPLCKVPDPSFVGDGLCDTAPYNTIECGYDGGDCKTFPVNCTVEDTYAIGDGVCHIEFNTTDCEYDGGDCLL